MRETIKTIKGKQFHIVYVSLKRDPYIMSFEYENNGYIRHKVYNNEVIMYKPIKT